MISPEQAGNLLDELVYERVYSCIDLNELTRFANELMSALDECGVADKEVSTVARDMVMRALTRIRDEIERTGPLGAHADPFDDDCPLCVDLAQHERAAKDRHVAKSRTS